MSGGFQLQMLGVLTDSTDVRQYIKKCDSVTYNWNPTGVQFVPHLVENQDTARRGGKIAGDARKKLEKESGRKVITSENYLDQPEVVKKLGTTDE